MHAMMVSSSSPRPKDWFFDARVTHHLTKNSMPFTNLRPYSGSDQVTVGNGHSIPMFHTGNMFLSHSFLAIQITKCASCSSDLCKSC